MIETTLTLSIATGILIAAAIITGVACAYTTLEDWWRDYKFKKQEEKRKKSTMVRRFQYLAGITNSYEEDDGTLRSRFNRVRSTCYSSSYNTRFNLRYL